LAACSTDLISTDARAVLPAAVWMLLAISRVVAACSSTAAAIEVETEVSSWMVRPIEPISATAP
jgi:hypothetical protein